MLQEFFEDKFICYTLDLLAEQEQKLLISLYTRLSKVSFLMSLGFFCSFIILTRVVLEEFFKISSYAILFGFARFS